VSNFSNKEIARLLSIDTHRPILEKITRGVRKYEEQYRGVIEEVNVQLPGRFSIDYKVEDGLVKTVPDGRWKSWKYFHNPTRPAAEEVDLLEICEPDHHQWLKEFYCREIMEILTNPSSCTLTYCGTEKECPGCGRWGRVNYGAPGLREYFCGRGPRCCP